VSLNRRRLLFTLKASVGAGLDGGRGLDPPWNAEGAPPPGPLFAVSSIQRAAPAFFGRKLTLN